MIKVYIIGKSTGRPYKNVLAHPHPSNPSIQLQWEKTDMRIRGYWETLPIGYIKARIPTNPPLYSIVYDPNIKKAIGDYYHRDDFLIPITSLYQKDDNKNLLPDDLFEIS
jgi:hypothetical protein